MNIFTQIKNSVYNKEYYQSTVLNQPLGVSIKYLMKLSLLLALVGSIIFSISLPHLFSSAKSTVTSLATDYPEDLIVTFKDGNASINKPEPYFVKIPDSLREIDDSKQLNVENRIENLIVINTTEAFSINKFKEYNTASLLTKTELISMQSNNGEIKITPISKLGNVEITKSWILDKESIFMKALPWIVSLIIPVIFVGISIGIFVGTLMMLLFSALIVWIILKIKKVNISYKKSYQVALHASTIILIISIFGKYLGPFNNFSVNLLIFVVIIIINFSGYPKSELQ